MRYLRSFWFLLVALAVASIVLVSFLQKNLASRPEPVTVENFLLGTLVEIKCWDPRLDDAALRQAVSKAFDRIRDVEAQMSLHQDGSVVNKINEAAGRCPIDVPDSLLSVLKMSRSVSELSDGAFDVTIGAVTRLWDFTSGDDALPPEPLVIAGCLELVDYRRLLISATDGTVYLEKPGMSLDLGGVAKGYAIDLAAAALQQAGVSNFIVNAGGDLYVSGMRPDGKRWRIGVRDPRAPGSLMCTVLVSDRAIVASGDYERFFEHDGKRFHHILDPKTGYPAPLCQSVTVMADNAEFADALATAVFVMGPKSGLELVERLSGVEALIVDDHGTKLQSKGFGEYLAPGSFRDVP